MTPGRWFGALVGVTDHWSKKNKRTRSESGVKLYAESKPFPASLSSRASDPACLLALHRVAALLPEDDFERSLSPPPDSADAVETQTTSLDTDVATQTEIVQMANRELQMALPDFVIVQPGDGANAQQPDGATASSADGATAQQFRQRDRSAATCGGWRANDKGQWSKWPVGETQGPVAEVAAGRDEWSGWRGGGGGRDEWAGWHAGGGGPAAWPDGHAGGGGHEEGTVSGLRALLGDGRRLRGP